MGMGDSVIERWRKNNMGVSRSHLCTRFHPHSTCGFCPGPCFHIVRTRIRWGRNNWMCRLSFCHTCILRKWGLEWTICGLGLVYYIESMTYCCRWAPRLFLCLFLCLFLLWHGNKRILALRAEKYFNSAAPKKTFSSI